MKSNLMKTIILFVALVIAGVCLMVFGQEAVDRTASSVLPFMGAAIFGSSLTYSLVKLA
jgi:hypothetical protein